MYDDMFARSYLQKELIDRKNRNHFYSLRAFARDLDISPSNLSEFLSAKRDFSQKNSIKVAKHLDLSSSDFERFILSCQFSSQDSKGRSYSLPKIFQMMSHWYYFALLNLAKVKNIKADPKELAERLAIKEKQIEEALENLKSMNLIEITDGRMERKQSSILSVTKIPALAIARHHKSLLSQAGLSLFKDPLPSRDMRSIAIPIDPQAITKARDLLLNCREKIASLMTNEKSGKLYILSYFLFPVTSKH